MAFDFFSGWCSFSDLLLIWFDFGVVDVLSLLFSVLDSVIWCLFWLLCGSDWLADVDLADSSLSSYMRTFIVVWLVLLVVEICDWLSVFTGYF